MSLENPIILDHYRNPRNVGELEAADAVGIVENPACGDVLQLYVSVAEGRVTRTSFKAFGCAPAIAAGSVLTEVIKGATIAEMGNLTREDIADALGGLPPMKSHCSELAIDAIRAVLQNLQNQILTT